MVTRSGTSSILRDIDDKTIAESARRGVALSELTRQYAREFFEDMATLRMFPADHYPRATEHVDDMLDLTRKLVAAGLAYEMQRSVYFDISKVPAYGKLSRVDRAKIRRARPSTWTTTTKRMRTTSRSSGAPTWPS